MMLGKLQRAHSTKRGQFAPAYLVGSNMLRAYLFFIYACAIVNHYLIVTRNDNLVQAPTPRSVCMLSNTTAIVEAWSR